MRLATILTLGMVGPKKRNPLKKVVLNLGRPPMFSRPSKKATIEVLKKYVPEPELETSVLRVGKGDNIPLDTLENAKGLLEDLKKIGWEEFHFETIDELNSPVIWDPQKRGYTYVRSFYVEKDKLLHDRDVSEEYSDKDHDWIYISDYTGEKVQPLSELSHKEAIKYVTKYQESCAA